MSRIRIIDQHAMPEFARVVQHARSAVGAEKISNALDASRVLAVLIQGLSDAETLVVSHAAELGGLQAIALDPEAVGTAALAVLGPVSAHFALAGKLGGERGTIPDLAEELTGAIERYGIPRFTVPLPGGGTLEFGDRTLVMGILNATPDSFSDGGDCLDPDVALARARAMVAEGADIVDVGGESTRPGSSEVPPDEERRRVLPVIERLVDKLDVPVSVDTRRGAVARDALIAGAQMVNDVSGLSDPLTAAVAARAGAPVVVMHMRGTPETMQQHTDYDDVMHAIADDLAKSLSQAVDSGVHEESLIVDPGIGFAKTAEQCFEVVRRLGELKTLGRPIAVGPSRKSFLATVRDVEPKARVALGIGAALAAVKNGAHLLRVHDVGAATDAVRAFEASVRVGGMGAG
jgi:dihydropteroate synthase